MRVNKTQSKETESKHTSHSCLSHEFHQVYIHYKRTFITVCFGMVYIKERRL